MILCTQRNAKVIENLLKNQDIQNIKIKTLYPYWYFTLMHYLEIKLQLRAVIFFKYRSYFKSFDILVCTQFLDLRLKSYIPDGLKFVYTTHGAGSRPYAFKDDIMDFDLFFIAGVRDLMQRKKMNQLTPINHCLTGYLKFDLLKNQRPVYPFQRKKRRLSIILTGTKT